MCTNIGGVAKLPDFKASPLKEVRLAERHKIDLGPQAEVLRMIYSSRGGNGSPEVPPGGYSTQQGW